MKKLLKTIFLILSFLNFNLAAFSVEWGKILPSSFETNIRQGIKLNAETLWDERIEESWFEPLWTIPWEISYMETKENFKKIFGSKGYPEEDPQIIWQLDGFYEINLIKVFVKNSWRCVKIEADMEGEWITAAIIGPYGQADNSWSRETVSGIVTDKIRITFPNGWEEARFISELEIWGAKISSDIPNKSKILNGFLDEENQITWFMADEMKTTEEIFVVFDQIDNVPECFFNGYKLEKYRTAEAEKSYVFQVDKRMLREDIQFIGIKGGKINQLCLVDNYFRGWIETPENLSIERISVKFPDGSIEIIDGYGRSIEDIDLSMYQGNVNFLYCGSPMSEEYPYAELYGQIPDEIGNKNILVGKTGSSKIDIDISGYGVSRMENIFWFNLNMVDACKLKGNINLNSEIEGKKTTFSYSIIGEKNQRGGELFFDKELQFTENNSFTISGKTFGNNTEVYINGEKVKQQWGSSFETDIKLQNGLQEITVETVTGGEISGFWKRYLYKLGDGGIRIITDGAEKILTRESKYRLEGRIENAAPFDMYVNGEKIETHNGYFEISTNLEEGLNEFFIIVKDVAGRENSKTITIRKDTTKPEVNIQSPTSGSYYNTEDIQVVLVSSETDIWYSINKSSFEKSNGKVFSKYLNRENGFHKLNIVARDEIGNISEYTTDFCIDTTNPEISKLSLGTEIEKSDDSEYPILTVNITASDSVSGIDKYYYRTDIDESWKECGNKIKIKNPNDGTNTFFIKVRDKAGNETEDNIIFLVEQEQSDDSDFMFNILKSVSGVASYTDNSSEMTLQERIIAGSKYTVTKNKADNLTVSMENGSLYNECVDFVIYGKEGFSFPFKRVYSTQKAIEDNLSTYEIMSKFSTNLARMLYEAGQISEKKYKEYKDKYGIPSYNYYYERSNTYFMNKEDYSFVLGNGWRFDLPGLSGTAITPSKIRLTNGRIYAFSDLKKIKEDDNVVLYTCHKGDDFTFRVNRIPHYYGSRSGSGVGYEITDINVIEKDGTTYQFDYKGKLLRIFDASQTNVIYFEYDDKKLLTNIIDPFNNRIEFTYDKDEKGMQPYITQVDFISRRDTIKYLHDTVNSSVSNLSIPNIDRKEFRNLPRLVAVEDKLGRKTKYDYFNYKDKEDLYGANVYSDDDTEVKNYMDLSGYFKEICSYLNKDCYDNRVRIFAKHYPELLRSIISPEGFYQEIEYSAATYNAIETTSGWGSPKKRKVIDVASIVSVNGPKAESKYYNFTKELNKYNQIIMKESEMRNGKAKEKYIFTKKTEGDNKYSLLSSKTVLLNNDEVMRTEYTWNSRFLLTKETITKGQNQCIINNSYTNWGDVYKQNITKTDCLGNTTVKIIESEIRHTDSPVLKDSVFSTRPNTPSVESKGIMNLITKQKITTDGKVTYKGFQYDAAGRLIWEGIYLNDSWAVTNINYTIHDLKNFKEDEYLLGFSGYNFIHLPGGGYGLVSVPICGTEIQPPISGINKTVKMPSGQIYQYDDAYNCFGNLYFIKETIKDVQLSEDLSSSSDIITKKAINTLTGKVVFETDGKGIVTRYEYDSLGRITKKDTTDSGGYIEIIEYDDSKRTVTISKMENSAGEKILRPSIKYYFDSRMNVIKITRYNYVSGSPDEITESMDYDEHGNLISYKDERGFVTAYEYDDLGRITYKKHPNGFIDRFEYEDKINRIRKTNNEYNDCHTEYVNFDGKPLKIVKLNWLYEKYTVREIKYDSDGRIIKDSDSNNYSTLYEYNPLGEINSKKKDSIRLLNTKYSVSGSGEYQNPLSKYKYDNCGNLIEEMTGTIFIGGTFLRTTSFDYNGNGNILRKIDSYCINDSYSSSDERISTYTYDSNGNKIKETDPEGYSKFYSYNKMNKISSIIDEEGMQTTFDYDCYGNNTKITKDNKYISLFYYDDFGNIIKTELPPIDGSSEKNITEYRYDAHGNLIYKKESNGRVTEYMYDSENRKIYESVTAGDNNTITRGWKYYPYGKIKSEYEGCVLSGSETITGGIQTQYKYDNYGRLCEKTFPNDEIEQYTYYDDDNIKSIIYADGSTKSFEYNKLGFLTKETDEESNVTEHYYDVWGEETYRVENKISGNIKWKYEYNDFGELTREIQNDIQKSINYYDKRGLITETQDAKGIKSYFSYDGCRRLIEQRNKYDNNVQTKKFIYDSLGNLIEAIDGDIKSTMDRNNAYALTTNSTTKVNNKILEVSYGYDKAAEINYVKYPDKQEVNFTYDYAGYLISIGKGKTSSNNKQYASDGKYDRAGNLIKLTAGNGSWREEDWEDTKGILLSYGWNIGKESEELFWNMRGCITEKKTEKGNVLYEYDKKIQLTTETKNEKTNTWEYDETGNRKKDGSKNVTFYSFSDLIKYDGTWKYCYDKNGNMISKGKTASSKTGGDLYEGWSYSNTAGQLWKYEYDSFNRLVKVLKSTTGIDGLKTVAEYKYDYRNLMVYRKTGGKEEYFAYTEDGKLLYNEKENIKRDYVYANGSIWCEIQGDKVYYHHTDYQGTTEYITDESKNVVWECEYEAFGKVLSKTDTMFTPNYTGKFMDATTGLYYFNARWYSPDTGRFITEDSARDGRNWFIYCSNNPLIFVDPTGMFYYEGNTQKSNSEKVVSPYLGSPVTSPTNNNLSGYIPSLFSFTNGIKEGLFSLGTTFIDNQIDKLLNKQVNGDYEGSLYFQQYTSQVREYQEIDAALSIASAVPNKEVSYSSSIFAFLHNFEKRDGEIIANDITGFIKGAQLEIERIDNLIKDSNDFTFTDFLISQKDYLDRELNTNKDYFYTNYAFTNINGRIMDVDKNEYIQKSNPRPGIDYTNPIYRNTGTRK